MRCLIRHRLTFRTLAFLTSRLRYPQGVPGPRRSRVSAARSSPSTTLSLLTNHARVLIAAAASPDARVRDLAERTDQLRGEGLSEDEARHMARRRFGNVTLLAERTRDADVSLSIDAWLRDLRYSVRSLSRTPGFTCTVVLTLTLGIGANTAVFSAIDAVILRPLPFPDADRLMRLRQTQERSAESNIAPIRLEDWQRLTTTFEAITGYYVEDVSETSGDLPEKVRRAFIAPRFLEVWGIPAAIGRGSSRAISRASRICSS